VSQGKVFLWCFFLVCFVVIISLPLLNYFIDTSRVLTRDYSKKYDSSKSQGNVAFLKMHYLLERQAEYDSLILGSSRVNRGFSEADLSDALGGKWLKLAYPAGVPADHLHNLRVLFNHEHKIKRVLLTLDDFAIYSRPDRTNDYFYRLYPTTLKGWLHFYKFYLFKKPNDFEYEVLRGKVKLKKNRWFNRSQAAIEPPSLSEEELKKLKSGEAVAWFMARDQTVMKQVLTDIQLISDLCSENNAQLTIMVTPRFYKTLLWRDYNVLAEFKRGLVKISPFYDYGSMNEVSLSVDYWIDTSHFVRFVGKLVAQFIAGKSVSSLGVDALVTERNIENHLRSVTNKVINSIPSVFALDKTVAIHPSLFTEGEVPLELLQNSTLNSVGNSLMVSIPKLKSLESSRYILNVELKKVNAIKSVELSVLNRHEKYPSKRRFVKTYSFMLSADEVKKGVNLLFNGLTSNTDIKRVALYKLTYE